MTTDYRRTDGAAATIPEELSDTESDKPRNGLCGCIGSHGDSPEIDPPVVPRSDDHLNSSQASAHSDAKRPLIPIQSGH